MSKFTYVIEVTIDERVYADQYIDPVKAILRLPEHLRDRMTYLARVDRGVSDVTILSEKSERSV